MKKKHLLPHIINEHDSTDRNRNTPQNNTRNLNNDKHNIQLFSENLNYLLNNLDERQPITTMQVLNYLDHSPKKFLGDEYNR